MLIVAEQPVRGRTSRPRAGLAEEIERQEREDTDQGPEPEPEGRYVLRAGRWMRALELPATLPTGFVAAAGPIVARPAGAMPGADEIRVRNLMVAAMDCRGAWSRGGGAL
ncbi:hypothetical protein [Streptomyces sp. NPDC059783]|uniref:hypothetical protein n=1 Tax=Streptomyces sp. NPDC059783 TaxID=3346944 RepID=UPI00366745B2